tara:strand:+ start:216 stop:1574 length:1359 start_codon:yes stop_codon:yes gene_type:complete
MTTFIAKPSIARKRAYGGGMLKGALSPIQVNQGNPFGTVSPYLQGAQKLALAIMAGRENRQAANIEAEQAANKAAFTQSILGGISIPPNVVNPRPTGPISGRLASLGDFLLGKRVTRPEAYASLVGGMEGRVMPRALAGTFAHGAGVDPLQAAKIQAELAPDIPDPAKWTKLQVNENDALFNETTGETFVQAIMANNETGFFNHVTGKWLDPIVADRAMETAGDGSTETSEPPMSKADFEERKQYIKDLPETRSAANNMLSKMNVNRQEVKSLLAILEADDNVIGGAVNVLKEMWPGSDPANIRQRLNVLANNLAIDELIRMKESSAVGASGLGALNEKELETIQGIHATLSKNLSQAQLMVQLRKLDEVWARSMAQTEQKYNLDLLGYEITENDFNTRQLGSYPELLDLFNFVPTSTSNRPTGIAPPPNRLIDADAILNRGRQSLFNSVAP